MQRRPTGQTNLDSAEVDDIEGTDFRVVVHEGASHQ